MRLICPSCSASYNVGAAAIGAKGRMVRCAGCGAEWFQTPTDDSDEPMVLSNEPAAAPALAPPPAAPKAAVEAEDDGFYPVTPDPRPTPRADTRPDPVQDDDDEYNYASDNLGPIYYDPATGATSASSEVDEDDLAPPQDEVQTRRRSEKTGRDELAASLADVNQGSPARGGGAFLAGFSTIAVLAVIGIGIYVKADEIVALAPAAKPVIASYIELVDKGRLALQGFVG